MIIERTQIIGTNRVYFSAWEPDAGHSTINYSQHGFKAGRVGTRALPDVLDDLPPMSNERLTLVMEWKRAEYQEAYQAILEAHPELGGKKLERCMGQLVLEE